MITVKVIAQDFSHSQAKIGSLPRPNDWTLIAAHRHGTIYKAGYSLVLILQEIEHMISIGGFIHWQWLQFKRRALDTKAMRSSSFHSPLGPQHSEEGDL